MVGVSGDNEVAFIPGRGNDACHDEVVLTKVWIPASNFLTKESLLMDSFIRPERTFAVRLPSRCPTSENTLSSKVAERVFGQRTLELKPSHANGSTQVPTVL